jgi:hypothetical protein
MDPIKYILSQLLWTVLPWFSGTLAVGAALSLTPFGRNLFDYLRSRRRDSEMLEAVLQEMTELRATLTEVGERLDAAEHRLAQERAQFGESRLPSPKSLPVPAEGSQTPH